MTASKAMKKVCKLPKRGKLAQMRTLLMLLAIVASNGDVQNGSGSGCLSISGGRNRWKDILLEWKKSQSSPCGHHASPEGGAYRRGTILAAVIAMNRWSRSRLISYSCGDRIKTQSWGGAQCSFRRGCDGKFQPLRGD